MIRFRRVNRPNDRFLEEQPLTFPQPRWGAARRAAPALPFILLFGVGFLAVQPRVLILLENLPSPLLLLLALASSVTAVCAGQVYVHRRFKGQDFVQHNEVGGFIVAVVGTLYAVVLGFVTLAAWQHHADARQFVAAESAAAVDAWHVAYGLPPQERSRIRRDVLEYSQRMIQDEWPDMYKGDFDVQSGTIIMDAIAAVENFRPADFRESNAQTATLQQLGVVHDYRQRRLSENRSGVVPFEWLVLFLGAACVVCFCWLFGLKNATVHLLMTSSVTVIITSTLVLLYELQHPFRTGLGIPPVDWIAAIEHIHWMQAASQVEMHM